MRSDFVIWVYLIYSEYDVVNVSDEEYKQLKKLYTDKLGGWETIDLRNTKYNVKKWYSD